MQNILKLSHYIICNYLLLHLDNNFICILSKHLNYHRLNILLWYHMLNNYYRFYNSLTNSKDSQLSYNICTQGIFRNMSDILMLMGLKCTNLYIPNTKIDYTSNNCQILKYKLSIYCQNPKNIQINMKCILMNLNMQDSLIESINMQNMIDLRVKDKMLNHM